MSETDDEIEAAFTLARAGRTIDAIAAYRRATGVSLSAASTTIRAVERAAPTEGPGTGDDAVDAALRNDRKIQAIKAYRSTTGASLIDSKRAVEARAAELIARGELAPAPTAARSGASWLPALLVVLLAGCVVVFFIVTHR